ncbi:hypothetical protein Scep_008267 [Stephania cephalantha]|uniref:Centromere protein C n=1 Tax=Stephania cephalantha TaxID=152367 RepID=A0AAP0KCL9_9MAGN
MAADLVDPLHGLSVLSLLSRTLKGVKKGTASSEQRDLDSILSNLHVLNGKSSDVYLEEAKMVLSSSVEFQGDELREDVVLGSEVMEEGRDRPQERRPGLGKRARFSFKPNNSQPSLDLDESLNIEQLQDPEEFFAAVEKRESSAAKEPNKVDSLLDELLSVNATDLDGDGAVSLLEEHLQIKSIKLDKFCMPDFESLRKSDSKTIVNQRHLLRPRTPLSNVQNIVTRINQQERSAYPLAPPTQPKSPFSSLSMLKRRIALSDSAGNPFTFHSTDISSPSQSSPLVIDKRTPSAYGDGDDLNANDPHTPADMDLLNIPEKSHSTLPEGRYATGGDGLLGKLATENLSQPLEPMVDNGNRSTIDTGLQQNRSGRGLAEDKDLQPENVASENPGLVCQVSTTERLNSGQRRLDNSGPSPVEDHQMDQQSDTVNILPDRNNKDNQEPLGVASEKPEKEKGPRVTRRKRKDVPSRKSLAGAGTMWESGIRRSTRVRMRPLEYWKGERFLYGRVHESLLTVIGCKYESPSSASGKPKLKVKSFVSDNFKELVEKAALH